MLAEDATISWTRPGGRGVAGHPPVRTPASRARPAPIDVAALVNCAGCSPSKYSSSAPPPSGFSSVSSHLREEDGQSYVLSEAVSPQDEAKVRLAARSCPEQAISVT